MLEETFNPLVTESLENQRDQDVNLIINENLLQFQHDGVPSYYFNCQPKTRRYKAKDIIL